MLNSNVTFENMDGKIHAQFGWLDYLIFALMLGISSVIGVYFGSIGKKGDSIREYLHGGKTMGTIPVAASHISSMISGIMILGLPSEIYMHGTLFWLACVSAIIVCLINSYLYLPVFYDLQLTSVYEYLELRFNKRVRVLTSTLSTLSLLLYMPFVIYAPALALGHVSGLHLHYNIPLITIVCILYTMVGGMKAVVWTDFLQGFVMVVSSIAIVILGLINVGGFTAVWQKSMEGGRIRIFEMDPSPLVRLSFWSMLFGNTMLFLNMVVNQSMVQKFLSLPTFSSGRRSLYYFTGGMVIMYSICCFTGLILYAEYHNCDPMISKKISRPDELLTYYVMALVHYIPGFPGLFVSGIVSAALSTMSSYLNSFGAIVFEDFIRPRLKTEMSDRTANNCMKLVILIIGALSIALVYIIENLGLIIQVMNSLVGISGGAITAIFSFGILYPRGNAKGVVSGAIASLVIVAWLVFGTQKALFERKLVHSTLPITVEGCGHVAALPNVTMSGDPTDEVFILYRISFIYYSLIGFVIVFIVGIPVSVFTDPPDLENMNPAVFSPFLRKYVNKKTRKFRDNNQGDMELLNLQT